MQLLDQHTTTPEKGGFNGGQPIMTNYLQTGNFLYSGFICAIYVILSTLRCPIAIPKDNLETKTTQWGKVLFETRNTFE